MDDNARRDEKNDREAQRASRSNEHEEERDDLRPRRDPGAQRPPLTRREREDPWPIG
jgi:hypothetical protein